VPEPHALDALDAPAVVLDDAVVRNLTGHADDHAVGMSFATRFRELLPHRLWRIAQALEAGDHDRALDAVLSLKVSAASLGARQISGLAAGVERCLRLGDLDAGTRAARELGDAAGRLDAALRRMLAESCAC
jgi:HPt (histidine-containing phosphotransfer) domain-containing protein